MLRIQQLRKEKGVSQKQLAESLNVSQSNLCDWEKGRSEPDIAKLIQLAQILDTTVDYLIGNAEDDKNKYEYDFSLPRKENYVDKSLLSKLEKMDIKQKEALLLILSGDEKNK